MFLHIDHIPLNSFFYRVKEHPEYTAEYCVGFGYRLRKLLIYKNKNLFINVEQTNCWRRIFSFLFFFWTGIPPLIFSMENVCIGQSIKLRTSKCYELLLNHVHFALRFHSRNYVSIWKEEQQIGLMHTDAFGNYEVHYDAFGKDDTAIIFLLCLVANFEFERYGETRGGTCYYLHDPYKFAVNWTTSKHGEGS